MLQQSAAANRVCTQDTYFFVAYSKPFFPSLPPQHLRPPRDGGRPSFCVFNDGRAIWQRRSSLPCAVRVVTRVFLRACGGVGGGGWRPLACSWFQRRPLFLALRCKLQGACISGGHPFGPPVVVVIRLESVRVSCLLFHRPPPHGRTSCVMV